jgi:hypothetical protein
MTHETREMVWAHDMKMTRPWAVVRGTLIEHGLAEVEQGDGGGHARAQSDEHERRFGLMLVVPEHALLYFHCQQVCIPYLVISARVLCFTCCVLCRVWCVVRSYRACV